MQYYDLTEVAKWHPGGALPIHSSQGVVDATAAYESYHAFCNMDSIDRMLDKYEYTGPITVDVNSPKRTRGGTSYGAAGKGSGASYVPAPLRQFTFNQDGFYKTCLANVRAAFPGDINGSQRRNVKATSFWWMRFAFLTAVSVLLFTLVPTYTVASFLLGFNQFLIGFNVWHDLCHNAGPVNVTVREVAIFISTYLGTLFDTDIWSVHHNIKHHSYTGAHKHDPDEGTWNIAPGFILLLVSAPGQIFFYLYFRLTGKAHLWYMQRPRSLKTIIGPTTLAPLVFVSLMVWQGGYLCMLLSLVGMSVAYMSVVWADHFMPDTHGDSMEIFHPKNLNKSIDWGEVQVRGSADFFPNSLLADCLAGGMNYQIEHHLFPSMCSVHYPMIAPIVRQTCKEFNIPYRVTPSWLTILKNLLSHRGIF